MIENNLKKIFISLTIKKNAIFDLIVQVFI